MEKYWIFKKNVAKCRQCNKEYTKYINTSNIKRHVAIHNNPHFKNNSLHQYFEFQDNMLKCNVCGRLYKIQVPYNLRKHSRQHKSMIDTDRGKSHKRQDYWWIKYCILENGKAQCRFCDSFYYITIHKNKYENHVAINHNEIYYEIDKKENWIWQYFTFENNTAMCNLCETYFIVNLYTAGIRQHLDARHKDKIKETQDNESSEGIHDNAETIKSRLESLINDIIQIHKIKRYLEDELTGK